MLASPPSSIYRVRKFVRRHRIGVAAGGLVALALLLGMAGTTVGLVRATRAEAMVQQEAAAGCKRALILSPAFVADCLETLEELGIQAVETWRDNGGDTLPKP